MSPSKITVLSSFLKPLSHKLAKPSAFENLPQERSCCNDSEIIAYNELLIQAVNISDQKAWLQKLIWCFQNST